MTPTDLPQSDLAPPGIVPADPTAADLTPPVIVVTGVVLRDGTGAVLTVRKRRTGRFMLPGGKHEPGESALEAGVREVREEVGLHLDPADLELLGEFEGETANEPGSLLHSTVFVAPLTGVPAPTGEIDELRWLPVDAGPEALPADLAPLLVDHVLPALRDALPGQRP